MTALRIWALGIVLVIVLFAAVAVVATGLLGDPTGGESEAAATPIGPMETDGLGPIAELYPVAGETEATAVPLRDLTPGP